jgi:hypothetical protein
MGRIFPFQALAASSEKAVLSSLRPLLATLGLLAAGQLLRAECEYCPPLDPPGPEQLVVEVLGVDELRAALAAAVEDTTLLLADGVYDLSGGPDLHLLTPRLTLRSASGNRDAVIIQGGGNNLSIFAEQCTVADLTLRNAAHHNVQVHGEDGVLGTLIYNVRFQDSGEQLFKVSAGLGTEDRFGDEGTVACSLFEYTTHAPSDYTNGVNVLAGRDWLVRDNVFRRIRGPTGPAGPAILFWRNAMGTQVKRNLLVDCWRGIVLGLAPPDELSRGGAGVGQDHLDGLVENNVIIAFNEQVDAPIENNYAVNSRVFHNTTYTVNSTVFWSIECRFPGTTAAIKNNLTNRMVLNRSPGEAQAVEEGNLIDAASDWFQDMEGENFHLAAQSLAIDKGVALEETLLDIDGDARPGGPSSDVGADESGSVSSCPDVKPPAAPTGLKAVAGDREVSLDWDDHPGPGTIRYRVHRSLAAGGPYSFLALAASSRHVDSGLTNGVAYHYVVTALNAEGKESPYSEQASATPAPRAIGPFLRADCDGDGRVTGITDAVYLLGYNFLGSVEKVPCAAACDVNGDGAFHGVITDPIFLLNHSFLGGPPPPRPYPTCGFGTGAGDLVLGCEDAPDACQ